MKRRINSLSFSSMLLLLTACSDVSSPAIPEVAGEEVAVRFQTTMQPTVAITRAIISGTDASTLLADKYVGICGIRTLRDNAATYNWAKGEQPDTYHRQMKNKQYIFEEGNTLSPADSKLDYHPSRSDSALAVYAYWPHHNELTAEGLLPVDLCTQTDVLYTGKVVSAYNHATQTFAPVTLPLKHALSAVAFRFWTADSDLRGKKLEKIIISTTYDPTDIDMYVADGSFRTSQNGDNHTFSIDLTEGGTRQVSILQRDKAPIVGITMLLPGRGIKSIILHWEGNNDPGFTLYPQTDDDYNINLEAGKVHVLTFKANSTNELIAEAMDVEIADFELLPILLNADNTEQMDAETTDFEKLPIQQSGVTSEDATIEEGEMIVTPQPNEMDQTTGENGEVEEGEMIVTPKPNELEQNGGEGAVIEEGEMIVTPKPEKLEQNSGEKVEIEEGKM